MTLIETIIIAIVEGLTEFLPVSSTGHMIITQNLLGVTDRMQDDPTMAAFVHAFTFIIQFGAILSVVCLYWKRFFRIDHSPAPEGASLFGQLKHKFYFYWLLIVGVIPAIVALFIGSLPMLAWGIFFIAAAAGDIWMTWLLTKENPKSMVLDHPSEAGFYIID